MMSAYTKDTINIKNTTLRSFLLSLLVILDFRACFQLSEGYSSGLQEIFEEFLCKWKYVDRKGYVLENRRPHATADEGYSFLAVEKYLEVSEVYIFTLLRAALGDIDLAISWVEKAELPEEKPEVGCIFF
ncbi:hypothetical protein ACLOJK_019285 [Asimina triloba]